MKLSVSSAALVIPALFCFKGLIGVVFPYVYAVILLLVAVCFITNFKMKKIGMVGNIVMLVVGILLLAILIVLKVNGI